MLPVNFIKAFYDIQPAFWFMVGFIVLVSYLSFLDRRFVNKAVPVDGEVISYETIKDESSTLYEAKIRYVFQGQTYYQASKARSAAKIYKIGQRVELLVNPDQPREIRLQGRVSESPLRLFLTIMKVCMWFCVFIFFAAYISRLIHYM